MILTVVGTRNASHVGHFEDAIGEYKAYGVNYPDFTWENTSVGWIAY